MTHSPTPAELLAIKTGNAALLNSPDATCDIVSTVVFALGSAGLLMDPETAEELRKLRARVGDGSTRTVDEDPIAYVLTEQAEYVAPAPSCARCYGADAVRWVANGGAATDCPVCGHSTAVEDVMPEALHASSGAVVETARPEDVSLQVAKLRALLARQTEDAYVSPLHRDYRTPHDLPPVTS